MSKGKSLFGQLLYGARRIPIKFLQQMMDEAGATPYLGQPNVEINPNDRDSFEVKSYDEAAAQAELDAVFVDFETYEDIRADAVPDVIESIDIIYQKGGENANADDNSTIVEATTPFSVSASASVVAEASAFCVPKLKIKIKRFNGARRKVRVVMFYLEEVTVANIITRITAEFGGPTIVEWPNFNPVSETLVLTGTRVQATAKGNYGYGVSAGSGTGVTKNGGDAEGYRFDPVIDPVQLPFAIHGAINLTSSDSISRTATSNYSTSGFTGIDSSGTPTATATAAGSVSPSSLLATAGDYEWPITANRYHIYDIKPDTEDAFGRTMVMVTLFDFTP